MLQRNSKTKSIGKTKNKRTSVLEELEGQTIGKQKTQKHVFEELGPQNHRKNRKATKTKLFEESEGQIHMTKSKKQCFRGIGMLSIEKRTRNKIKRNRKRKGMNIMKYYDGQERQGGK